MSCITDRSTPVHMLSTKKAISKRKNTSAFGLLVSEIFLLFEMDLRGFNSPHHKGDQASGERVAVYSSSIKKPPDNRKT